MKNSLWSRFELFLKIWMLIFAILLAPLLIYHKLINEVSSETQLRILIPLLLVSVGIVIFYMYKNGEFGWNKKVKNEIKNGKAQVLKIKTDKVYKRKETYDLGSGFYLKISKNETLYLQGQYFDELQYEQEFPNTDFEIVRTKLSFNKLIHIKSFGEYIKPEKKLKAFTKEQFDKNEVHWDGDLLEIPIEQIK